VDAVLINLTLSWGGPAHGEVEVLAVSEPHVHSEPHIVRDPHAHSAQHIFGERHVPIAQAPLAAESGQASGPKKARANC